MHCLSAHKRWIKCTLYALHLFIYQLHIHYYFFQNIYFCFIFNGYNALLYSVLLRIVELVSAIIRAIMTSFTVVIADIMVPVKTVLT